jgi:outer membrane protein assembly factor BamC
MPIPGAEDSATYSQYASSRPNGPGISHSSEILPEIANVKILRDGSQRWLEIQSQPAQVWNKVLAFWRDNGIVLVEQNPATGVMKTDWLENRADIKQNPITDFLRRSLGSIFSAGTRDQFRIWLEPGVMPDTTALYLTHRGLEEHLITSATGGDTENSYWALRPSDPGLEAEMLRRIMIYLGVTEQTASSSVAKVHDSPMHTRTELIKIRDDDVGLLIRADSASAWRIVGIALERVGLAVEDRDRAAGLYYVQYDDPIKEKQGWFFNKLAFWQSTEDPEDGKYRLRLESVADATKDAIRNATRVVVLNSKGQPEQSETATRILTLIQEQIR